MSRGISFDRVASVYDATRGLPPGAERDVADRLARLLAKEKTLEVGVGTARWARPLQLRGAWVVGVDLGRSMLAVARSKGFSAAVQANALHLPFRDATFDGALANHLLHLLHDVPSALEEVGRVISGRLRSIVEYEVARPDLMGEYIELVGNAGLNPRPPGVSERSLARRLTPDRVQDASVFHVRASSGPALGAIESRAFRDTWGTPEPLHQEILSTLRRLHGRSEVLTETRVEIVEWDRRRLLDFAKEWRRDGKPPAEQATAPGSEAA
ncbi:MAG: methyltransferase domain-containing protein [Thermoplasmata archaeon]|nr:methyltransferase domain-containing protein [Thermoplasmata archaeon]